MHAAIRIEICKVEIIIMYYLLGDQPDSSIYVDDEWEFPILVENTRVVKEKWSDLNKRNVVFENDDEV